MHAIFDLYWFVTLQSMPSDTKPVQIKLCRQYWSMSLNTNNMQRYQNKTMITYIEQEYLTMRLTMQCKCEHF